MITHVATSTDVNQTAQSSDPYDGGIRVWNAPAVLIDHTERARLMAISAPDFPVAGHWALVWGRDIHPEPVWVSIEHITWVS